LQPVLMAARPDQRDPPRGRGAYDDFVVERPQILERAAAARNDEQVGPADRSVHGQRIEALDGGGTLLRGTRARRSPPPPPATPGAGGVSAPKSRCRMSRMTAPVGEVITPISSGRNGNT